MDHVDEVGFIGKSCEVVATVVVVILPQGFDKATNDGLRKVFIVTKD